MLTPRHKHILYAFLGCLALTVLVGAGWASYVETRARDGAQAFCTTVKPGEAESDLARRALAAGADPEQTRWVQPLIGPRWLAATFIGLSKQSRHLCMVTVQAGRASSARYEFVH